MAVFPRDLENPWLFGVTVTLAWIGVFVLLELLVLGDDPWDAALQGLVGGLAFAIALTYLRRRGE